MQNEASGPQFELPKPPEISRESAAEKSQDRTIEKRPSSQEAGVGKRAPQPTGTALPDISQLPQTSITVPSDVTDQSPPVAPVSPATADLAAADTDLIEKDWVARTKSVVSQTQDDPHRQKNEMSRIKADYIHKRFKKIIKTDDPFDATQGRPEQSRSGEAAA